MILVSGGTGLVGSHLLMELSSDPNNSIRALYRNKESLSKCKKVFASENKLSQFKTIDWQKADLLDYFSLKDQMQGVKIVYHAAATVSFSAKDAEQMMRVNVEGTAHLANLSLEYGVQKFCFVSSVAALGEYPDKSCSDEDTIWQKTTETSNYSISKYYAENEVWRANQEGLPVVIVNPATILGYGDWTESSSTIIKKASKGLLFYPPGSNGFVGVKDVVKVMKLLMESEIEGERFVLVSENLSFQSIMGLIAQQFGKKLPSIKVNKKAAKLMMYLDQIRALLSGTKPMLTRESLQTAFKQKCYSAAHIKNKLNFEFEPIEESIEQACKIYRKESA
ncbi:MAG: NAD-dependent epimerase/dehydratase family protein [Vicingaceae bacterium]